MDRKMLTSDFLALKAEVKAEMLRRCHSGSVAEYGGEGYDFSTPPTDGGPLLGEHLEKNLAPMQAVDPDGLPVYPGGLDRQGLEAMETKVQAWKTRALTDESGSDCKAGCTGTCYAGCATGCKQECSGACKDTCKGCDGCDGCDGGCDGCDGCGGACSNSCRNTCKDGCSKTCTDSCSGCGSSCSSDCIGCDWLVNT